MNWQNLPLHPRTLRNSSAGARARTSCTLKLESCLRSGAQSQIPPELETSSHHDYVDLSKNLDHANKVQLYSIPPLRADSRERLT